MSPSRYAGLRVYQSAARVARRGVATDMTLKGPPWTYEPIQPKHTTPQSSHYVSIRRLYSLFRPILGTLLKSFQQLTNLFRYP